MRRAFLLWCTLHAGMGVIDLAGKLSGVGDVLAPIRTASYSMLTDVDLAGFVRIAGAYSEASSFGGVSLACLAFTYTYWRKSGDRYAKWLSVVLLCLLLLSTSSTAYAGLMALGLALGFGIGRSAVSNRLEVTEVAIVALLSLTLVVLVAMTVFDEVSMEPILKLIDTTLIDKIDSESGQERTYWNVKSLRSLADTSGMGVGFGSSRASSWIVAVVSQLGVIGALMMASMAFVIIRGLGRLRTFVDHDTATVVSAVRASSLGSMVAGSLISGTADPGMIFFLAFAVVAAVRVRARRTRDAALARCGEARWAASTYAPGRFDRDGSRSVPS